MSGIGPLFKWFGSKWMSARTLPSAEHDNIVEPFAGGAGYSLRHCEKKVTLLETDRHISHLWKWLIAEATTDLVMSIPLNTPEGTDIRTLGLSDGQSLLLKSWQRTNNVGECWTISPWGNKPGQWTANTRARVASEIHRVKHWTFIDGDSIDWIGKAIGEKRHHTIATSLRNATWFVDPPYQFNYQYRSKAIDYDRLGKLCRSLPGQVIVCEAICQKTGNTPEWLPFKFFGSRITSRRKAENNHHSKELIWTSSTHIDNGPLFR